MTVPSLDSNILDTKNDISERNGQDDFDEFKYKSKSVLPPPPQSQDQVTTSAEQRNIDSTTNPITQSTEENEKTKQSDVLSAGTESSSSLSETNNNDSNANVAPEATTSTIPDGTVTASERNSNNLEQQQNIQENQSSQPNANHPRFVTPKDFELLKVIGMGAFGKVLQVRSRKNPTQLLAMKVISKRLIQKQKAGLYIENIQAERNILTKVIGHPFIVTMHCSFQTADKLFIIMDFLAGGELFLRLGREGIFLEKQASFYLAEIILALDHLHTLGILHRDLKPENILLSADGHICLTDFGLAKDFNSFKSQTNTSVSSSTDSATTDNDTSNDELRTLTICGTHEYMSPEMLARQGYGRASDYWSLGCIAYEMLAGVPPFESKLGAKDLFRKIMSEKVKMPSGSSAPACKLLKGLLNRNVQNRLGTAKSTLFEVGGVTGLKQQEFFRPITDWDKLLRKEIPPPVVPTAVTKTTTTPNPKTQPANGTNPKQQQQQPVEGLENFHSDFTTMELPRSVVIMSTSQNYNPHRVMSTTFRGFSFVHDDFVLPERDPAELDTYWYGPPEEDRISESDCASSKMGGEGINFSHEQEETINEKKKRPPRNRKKKKNATAAETNTSTQQDGVANADPTNTAGGVVPIAASVATPSVTSMENAHFTNGDEYEGMASVNGGVQTLTLQQQQQQPEEVNDTQPGSKSNIPMNDISSSLPSTNDKVAKQQSATLINRKLHAQKLKTTPPPPPPQPIFSNTPPPPTKPKPKVENDDDGWQSVGPTTAPTTAITAAAPASKLKSTPQQSVTSIKPIWNTAAQPNNNIQQQQQQQQRYVVGMAPPGAGRSTPLNNKLHHLGGPRNPTATSATGQQQGVGFNRPIVGIQQQQPHTRFATQQTQQQLPPPAWPALRSDGTTGGSMPASSSWNIEIPQIKSVPVQQPIQPTIPKASSDWRQHTMSPHDSPGRKLVTLSSAGSGGAAWPTLGNKLQHQQSSSQTTNTFIAPKVPFVPPAEDIDANNTLPITNLPTPPGPVLKGAWAARKK